MQEAAIAERRAAIGLHAYFSASDLSTRQKIEATGFMRDDIVSE